MICGLELIRPDLQSKETFLHVLLLLTLIGSFMHTNMFDATRDKYYAILLALAYLPLLAGAVLPLKVSAVLWLLCIPAGLLGLRQVISFRYYREINQELLVGLFTQIDTAKQAVKTANEKGISADLTITSQKNGFEFLNELFIKRHRKILWRSALRIAAICATLCCGALLLMAFRPEWKKGVNEMVMTWLP